MVSGLGIDLVEVGRIEKIIEKWGDRFTRRVFSDDENSYCRNRFNSSEHYAVRFAAKEAFLKCVGLGIGRGISLNQIEVTLDNRGKPLLRVHAEANESLSGIQDENIHISLTHTKEYASAVVILER